MNKIYKYQNRLIGMVLSSFLFSMIYLTTVAQSVSFVRNVSTVAGSTQAYLDGPVATAKFDQPYATAVDAAGNIFVSDHAKHCIRKITPGGVVSTYAGTAGTSGTTDGAVSSAKFNGPAGLAVDASGNLYVADQINQRIRMITSAGVVSTLAGNNTATITAGFSDGTGTAAKFNTPVSVAVDVLGNVYVGDQNNHRIRAITSGGVVTTLAGSGTVGGFADGPGASAQFNLPSGVAVDASGNVYVGDLFNNCIRKITSGGVVSTLAGSTSSGYIDNTGSAAKFNEPYGVTVDVSGNVYVVDYYNQRIRKVTQGGVVSTIAGNGSPAFLDGPGPSARFNYPNGINIDAAGNLYVADVSNFRIRKISTVSLSAFSSTFGTPSAEQTFNVIGSTLTADLVVNAPAGYEVSLTSGSGFSSSVSLTQIGGNVSSTQIFIRLSSTAPAGTNSGNISLTSSGIVTEYLAVTGTVSKINQTITFVALAAKTIGQPSFTLTATASSGLTITYTSSDPSVATVAGNVVTIVGLGSTNITASQAGNTNYNAAADIVQALVVNKGNQTITFGSLPSKTVGDADFSLTATANSNLTITYTSSNPSVATVSGNIITIVGPGSTNITASQGGDGNYNAAIDVVQVLVVKDNQTITFGPLPSKIYGDGIFSLGATSSSGLNVTYSSSDPLVATVSGTTVTIVGAGTTNITASQAGNTIYNPASVVVQALTVDKANQNISFGTLALKTFGDAPFNLSATAGLGLTVTYISSNPSVATVTGNIVTIVGAGTTGITASQPGNNNYFAASDIVQALTVMPSNQTITFNALSGKTVVDAPFNLTGTSTSGLTVTYTSSDPSVATVAGNTVTIIGIGTTNITASVAGNNNYNSAVDVVQPLTVSIASQTITFSTLAVKDVHSAAFNLGASATSGLTVTYISSNTAVATVSGNTVTIVGIGQTNITASQSGNTIYGPAPDITQTLTVTLVSQTITFNTLPTSFVGSPNFTLGGTASSNLTVTYTSSNPAVATVSGNIVTIVGAGTTNITASQPGDLSTYSAAPDVVQILTVNAATGLAPMAVLESKIYPNPTFDVFIIEPKQTLYGNLSLKISDMQGKMVYSSPVSGGEESYKVDISSLGLGVFMFELSNGKEVIYQRIVKK